MKKEGERGKTELKKVLDRLSDVLQMEPDNMQEHLHIVAIEALADFIASSIKEER